MRLVLAVESSEEVLLVGGLVLFYAAVYALLEYLVYE